MCEFDSRHRLRIVIWKFNRGEYDAWNDCPILLHLPTKHSPPHCRRQRRASKTLCLRESWPHHCGEESQCSTSSGNACFAADADLPRILVWCGLMISVPPPFVKSVWRKPERSRWIPKPQKKPPPRRKWRAPSLNVGLETQRWKPPVSTIIVQHATSRWVSPMFLSASNSVWSSDATVLNARRASTLHFHSTTFQTKWKDCTPKKQRSADGQSSRRSNVTFRPHSLSKIPIFLLHFVSAVGIKAPQGRYQNGLARLGIWCIKKGQRRSPSTLPFNNPPRFQN